MRETRTIIIQVVNPSTWTAKRLALNAFLFASQMAVVGIGVLVGSAAMQWLGVLVWFLMLIAMAISAVKASTGLTVAEARKRLDDIEAGLVL